MARPGSEMASAAVLATPPAEADRVRFHEPAARVLAGVRVRTLVPDPGEAMDFGLKLAVKPEGSPMTERDVAELKPPPTAVVTLVVDPVLASVIEAPERVNFRVGVGAGVAAAVPQEVTRLSASTEPHPVDWSYPAAELNPVTPGTVLLPEVTSWKTAAAPEDWEAARW
jgi:hypothetical protein